MIKALAAPFRSVRFIPTGGVTTAQPAPTTSRLPAVLAVGGTWMVAPRPARRRRLGRDHPLTAAAAPPPDSWRSCDDVLELRPAEECRYDLVSLGEVMLRLDPGEGRVRTARSFRVWEGGGEYNVARGLRRCFGLRTAIVTAFADNEVGPAAGGPHPRRAASTPRSITLGALRRHRPHRPQRPQLHRARLRRARRGRHLRPRPHRGQPAATRTTSTGSTCSARSGVRWLHTGGIYAALSRDHAGRRSRRRWRPPAGTAPSSRTT